MVKARNHSLVWPGKWILLVLIFGGLLGGCGLNRPSSQSLTPTPEPAGSASPTAPEPTRLPPSSPTPAKPTPVPASTATLQPPEPISAAEIEVTGASQQDMTSVTEAIECDHEIGLSVGIANARRNFEAVEPGDTVCLMAGERESLSLRNFAGTAEKPIVFINYGGQVIINTSGSNALALENSRYVRLTGSGESMPYGIRTDGELRLGHKSSHVEIDHIETRNLQVAADATCADGSPHDYRGWDYNDDGLIDALDAVNRDNFSIENIRIHNNYVHDSPFEGMYIGPAGFDTGQTLDCPNSVTGTEVVYPPVLRGVDIYDNLVERSGWEGIEVKSALVGCRIHHNRVLNYTVKDVEWDNGGIALAHGSTCDIFNNFIKAGKGTGIELTGHGGNRVYNNVIIEAGRDRIYSEDGAGIKVSNTGDPENSVYIWNNTIVNPLMSGIVYQYQKGSDNRIQNNLIVNPGSGTFIDLHSRKNLIVSHNLGIMNIIAAKFTDPGTDDYSLQPDSPAIDAGVNLNTENIDTDYPGTARPARSNYDIGAYEFILP